MSARPKVTVAAVIARDGRFLLVEEERDGRVVLNQPAGHMEAGESVLAAAVRETLEETGRRFRPESLVGVYRWENPNNGFAFVRFAFCGDVSEPDPALPLDAGIVGAVWLDHESLRADPQRLRSPMVLQCIEDYLAGRRYPLDLITDLD